MTEEDQWMTPSRPARKEVGGVTGDRYGSPRQPSKKQKQMNRWEKNLNPENNINKLQTRQILKLGKFMTKKCKMTTKTQNILKKT